MGEIKHTPEPWKISGRIIYDANGTELLRANPCKSHTSDIEKRQIAIKRAVECVNACAGIGVLIVFLLI